MGVHIGELHTDVVTTEAPARGQTAAAEKPMWELDHRAVEAMQRAKWLHARVCAEGFDD